MIFKRPRITQDDNYFSKIIKYIPAEIITAFTAISGALAVDSNVVLQQSNIETYCNSVLVLIILTPIYMYYAVIDSQNSNNGDKKKALFHAGIATASFIIYVFAAGHRQMIAILYDCVDPKEPCLNYFPAYGAAILGLFTVITPIIERIVLGPS